MIFIHSHGYRCIFPLIACLKSSSPLTALRSPLFAHRSSLTALRSPLFAHRSSLTALRSPLFAYRSPLAYELSPAQLCEECNLPELTPHGLNIIKDYRDGILAIGIILNNLPEVCENTGEEFVHLHCYLMSCIQNF
jgi:hypothetical protein